MSNLYTKINHNITLGEVISFLEIKYKSEFQEQDLISNFKTLEDSTVDDLTFLASNAMTDSKYKELIKTSRAKYCLIQKENLENLPNTIKPIIVEENPYILFLKIYKHFYKITTQEGKIDNSAKIDQDAYISKDTIIEENVVIEPNVYIGNNVIVKKNTKIESNASIKNTSIGEDCRIGSGSRIGQDGFGFLNEKIHGTQTVYKIEHFGGVKIGNNVSIGSNTCIDRGMMSDTIIGDFTKIDNLVQIAHNVQIGYATMIAGCTGIAGSAKIGNKVLIGGRVSIAGHINIGDNSIVYGQTSVSKSFPAYSKIFSGWMAENYRDWVIKLIVINKIVDIVKKLLLFKKYFYKFFSLKK